MPDLSALYNAGKTAASLLGVSPLVIDAGWLMSGGYSAQKQQESNQVQIDYNQYMKGGNQRALDDWNRLYGSKGLSIRYPELSYAGSIAGYSAGISRANLSSDIASSNYVSSLPYRGAGLYNVAGRVARSL